MIATSTKVEISGVNLEKFDDKYFAKEAEKKKKKGEGEFFEAEKEVCLSAFCLFYFVICVCFIYENLHLQIYSINSCGVHVNGITWSIQHRNEMSIAGSLRLSSTNNTHTDDM